MNSDKLLILHSDKSNNNSFTLDKRIQGLYQLRSFVATNNIYNVNDNNNKIYIEEDGTDHVITATLSNGYYDSSDLKTHLSTTLNNSLNGTVTVEFDENTYMFTFSNTNGFRFVFGANTTNSARKLLGFNPTDGIPNTSQTSDIPIDLNPYKNIFITITEDDNRNVEGIDFFNCSLIVNGTFDFGAILRYVDVDNFAQILKFKNTKMLKVFFHDANNNIINLNSEYQIILQKLSSHI